MGRNTSISFTPMGLGDKAIEWYPGRTVVVYTLARKHNAKEFIALPGKVIKAARVNVTVEYDLDSSYPITENFRRDTQQVNDNTPGRSTYVRTLEQDEMDLQARDGLEDLGEAGVNLDRNSRLSADQIVALATTVRNHHSFLSAKQVD
jgi:hypothetical protein